ncbi:dihydrofolate reductase [Litoribacter alkaliphilus]|uniref:Dihydrofolate reductase n=2 Tax=Litoribacter ruber TaxID=702568 RepID=A0AAP2G4T9_9BACT|nr:dihydrofolate reductase family protein [Litoribacter alkaliphilus]MBS9523823.1 dihydrofolate reductase [Litoribacter alkaliphilus]
MSVDGYIAKSDDNLDFLQMVERPNEDYGYADHLNNIDTIIWGRRTFDKILKMEGKVPHVDKKIFVVSKSETGKREHAEYHPDAVGLVHYLQSQPGKDIYCDGGAQLVTELLRHQLIDRLIISIIPHLLGDGIRLFKEGNLEQKLIFKRSITYPSGLVQVWYDVKKE